MLTATIHACDLTLTAFYAQGSDHANQDRWMAQPLSTTQLRVGVIDGVTPWRSPERPGDPAQWAAAVCLQHLSLPIDLHHALLTANAVLHQPGLTPSRRQSMAAVAGADLHRDGLGVIGDIVVAADCEAWAADDAGALSLLAGGEFRTPETLETWASVRAEHEPLGLDERRILEAVLLDDPGSQRCHAVGRYAVPVLDITSFAAPALVLGSDGACLAGFVAAGGRASDIDSWLQDVERRSSRDDFTCLVITAH